MHFASHNDTTSRSLLGFEANKEPKRCGKRNRVGGRAFLEHTVFAQNSSACHALSLFLGLCYNLIAWQQSAPQEGTNWYKTRVVVSKQGVTAQQKTPTRFKQCLLFHCDMVNIASLFVQNNILGSHTYCPLPQQALHLDLQADASAQG